MSQKIRVSDVGFEGLFIAEPNSQLDFRGGFGRIFCEDELSPYFNGKIKQMNHSVNKEKGTVRGLHFQYEPYAEVKMIKCIKGAVFDIVVDVRKGSKTFLKFYTVELTAKNQKMLIIPKGFAHGFQTLEQDTELIYLHSSIYQPTSEAALNVKDPMLNINLPLEISCISRRDSDHCFIDKKFQGVMINEL